MIPGSRLGEGGSATEGQDHMRLACFIVIHVRHEFSPGPSVGRARSMRHLDVKIRARRPA